MAKSETSPESSAGATLFMFGSQPRVSVGWARWFSAVDGGRIPRIDVYLAVVGCLAQVAGVLLYGLDDSGPPTLDPFGFVLLVAGPAALLFRRRLPELVLGVTVAVAASYVAMGYPPGPGGYPAFVVAMISAVFLGRRVVAWLLLAIAYVLLALVRSSMNAVGGLTVGESVLALVWIPLVAAGGEIMRVRLERRMELARSEEAEARRRAGEERLAVARELHDVLAHDLSLISVQAGMALHNWDQRPDQAHSAIRVIRKTCGEALGELRSVLDFLGSPAGLSPLREPTAGLGRLDGLLERVRASGLGVELVVEGTPVVVGAQVDLTAFRVVQEALTNVVRHSGSRTSTISLGYEPDRLTVEIVDTGGDREFAVAETEIEGAGTGIEGMRERVEKQGGSFAAGPTDGGGFRVHASLPLIPESA